MYQIVSVLKDGKLEFFLVTQEEWYKLLTNNKQDTVPPLPQGFEVLEDQDGTIVTYSLKDPFGQIQMFFSVHK